MALGGGIASAVAMTAFDPLSAFMKAGGYMPSLFGGVAGGGVGAGLAATAAPLALGTAASAYIGAGMHGAQQQHQIQGQLGQFGFANSASRTGQGFTRDDALSIGNQIRHLAHIPEMMTSVDELTKLIPRLKASGIMQGVKDATEFNSRFKDAVKTIREVSKVIGSTMEEASAFFEHSRSVGFLGKNDQLKNAMNVQFTAAQTGMSSGQVMQVQQAGAQMAVGRGLQRKTGTTAITNIMQGLGAGMQSGRISQDQLEDVTGVAGEGAVGAAAQQMAEKMARFAEGTAAGRASMMGLAKFDANGRFVGIDQDLADRYARGEVSKSELMERIGKFSNQQKISASRKTGSMAMEFAGKAGLGGIGAFMKNVLAEGGHTGESMKYMLGQYGFGETEQDLMENMAGMGNIDNTSTRTAYERKQKIEAEIAERTDPSKIMKRIGTRLSNTLGFSAIGHAGAEGFEAIGRAYDEFVDDLVGRYAIGLSAKGSQHMAEALSSAEGRAGLKKVFALHSQLPTRDARAASSLGRGLAQVASLTPFHGAVVGAGGIEGAGRQIDKMMRGVHRTLNSASYDGAGSFEDQVEIMQDNFGMKKASVSQLQDRFTDLRKMGEGGVGTDVEDFTNQMINQIGRTKYEEANQANKIDMLRNMFEVRSFTNAGVDKGADAYNALIKAKGLGANGANAHAEAAMLISGAMKIGVEGKMEGSSYAEKVKRHAVSVQVADKDLRDSLGYSGGSEVSSAIASDWQVGVNLHSALVGTNARKITDILHEDPTPENREALGKLLGRPTLSEDEFNKTKAAHKSVELQIDSGNPDSTERSKRKAKIADAIAGRVNAEGQKDVGALQIAARDVVQGMGKGELRDAMEAFGRESNSDKAIDKSGELYKTIGKKSRQLTDLQARRKAEKDPAKRKKLDEELESLSKELGPEVISKIRSSASQVENSIGKVGTSTTVEKLMSDTGLTDDQIGLGKKDTKVQITDKILSDIKAKVAEAGGAGIINPTKNQKKEALDEKLNTTLVEIGGTLKQVNTGLALQGADKDQRAAYYKKHGDTYRLAVDGDKP
jgi:hypothetical protein